MMNCGHHDPHDPAWSWALAGVLLASCVVVPCVFTTRLDAVFVVPKLAVLWGALALSFALIAVGVLQSRRFPRGARVHWVVDAAVETGVLALNVAAWAFSTDREQSLYGERLQYQGLLTLLLYVSFFYVARLSIADGRRMRLLFCAVAIGATLVSGYALVQKAGLDPIWEGYLPSGRVFSSIGQPNALAAYLVLAIPVSAALLFGTCANMRRIVLLAVVAMTAGFVLTRSRGGLLGFLAALTVLAVGWRPLLGVPSRRLRYRVTAALVAGTLIVAVSASVGGELPRISSDDSSLRFHLDAWRVAAQVAAEHPVLGTGQETFPDIFPRYSHAVLPPERATALDAFRVESPHDVYLTIASGSGIPALIAYAGIIAGFFVAVLRAARKATREIRLTLVAVLAACTGHVVTDAFMTADVPSTWLFWVLMGAALGLISQSNRQSSTFHVRP
jgi:O-antigen ligase